MAATQNTVVRKYNPGVNQSDDDLIKQFVVRGEKLDSIIEVLEENIQSPSNQHLLVVAPRGRGKTMLLARVAAEIRRSDPLRKNLLPVRLMEESHEVHSIADFWLECLLHLSNAMHELDPHRSKSLRQTHTELALIMDDKSLEQRARATVLDTADSLNRKLVLMIENLQDLAHDADDDFGWQLRKTLQTEVRIIFVATATSHFSALDDVHEPYYETFREIDLPSLDSEQCAKLWQVITGDSVSSREITPLRILTGGSPRLLVIVASFAQHRSMRQLMEELVTLVDENTEYFKSHLDSLARKERKVYLALVDLWRESTSQEIAQRARMEIRVTSALLGRLVNRGAVLVNHSKKKKFYVVSERLYSIYYKLRRERDDAAIVKSLIHFMSAFYTGPDLKNLIESVVRESKAEPDIKYGLQLALQEDTNTRLRFLGSVSYSDYQDTLSHSIDVGEWIKAQNNQAIIDYPEQDDPREILARLTDITKCPAVTHQPEAQVQIARVFYNRAVILRQQGQIDEALADCRELIERFGNSDHSEMKVPIASALFVWGLVLEQQGYLDKAQAKYRALIERFGNSDYTELQVPIAGALFRLGQILQQQDQIDRSLASYKELAERYGDSDHPKIQVWVARALNARGAVLSLHGQWDDALTSFQESMKRFGNSDNSQIKSILEWSATSITIVLIETARLSEALEPYAAWYEHITFLDETFLKMFQTATITLLAKGAAPRDILEILKRNPEHADNLAPLVVAIQQEAGDKVRAPNEVLETAADVRKEIEELRIELKKKQGK